jgi:hypothetical protein
VPNRDKVIDINRRMTRRATSNNKQMLDNIEENKRKGLQTDTRKSSQSSNNAIQIEDNAIYTEPENSSINFEPNDI